jgi:hypothetical protein
MEHSIKYILLTFPNVAVVNAEKCPGINTCLMLLRPPPTHSSVKALSLAGQLHAIPWYSLWFFSELVYLDISHTRMPRQIALGDLFLSVLRNLRVLRARDAGIDDQTAAWWCYALHKRLWALDVRDNDLTDRAVNSLVGLCTSGPNMASEYSFSIDGQLCRVGEPVAVPDDVPMMPTGLRRDDLTYMTRALVHQTDDVGAKPISGLTHLHLSGNRFSHNSLVRLLLTTDGQLECLTSDGGVYNDDGLPPGTSGFFTSLPLLPQVSPRLTAVEVHHSAVTHVPALATDNPWHLNDLIFSENVTSAIIDSIFDEPFVPNMNPRITDLTLTGIPQVSSGLIVLRLLQFIRCLTRQQRVIESMADLFGRGRIYSGLRHLTLVFQEQRPEHIGPIAEWIIEGKSGQSSHMWNSQAETDLDEEEALSCFREFHTEMVQQQLDFLAQKVYQLRAIRDRPTVNSTPTRESKDSLTESSPNKDKASNPPRAPSPGGPTTADDRLQDVFEEIKHLRQLNRGTKREWHGILTLKRPL